MALVWIALLIEFAAAFTVAAALAYWAQRRLTTAREERPRATARSSSRSSGGDRLRMADLRTAGNRRTPCTDR
ncbi:hypothetical protein [Saccharopolyspora gloriosae]|uniref:hypothetical protein n=1 Tax=Saccharopolyspora gloriosae TaxID=455344 RepID=UPI001FB5BD35|nr:hypothetical protein [Saccharopolyspora gloriosae]